MQLVSDAEEAIKQWAVWSRSGHGANVGYITIQPCERLRGSTLRSACITDEEAMVIDAAVSALRPLNQESHEALVLRYVKNYNNKMIEQEIGISRNRVADVISGGVLFVSGRLSKSVA